MDQPQPPAAPQPPQQPQWTPPPQQPMGWGAPGYGGPPVRPMGVTLGSIYLLVLGVLESLVGGCTIVGGSAISSLGGTDTTGTAGAIAGFVAGIGIFVLVLGILQIVAGAGALGGRGWARWLGIVLSVIFAVLTLLGALGTMIGGNNGITSGLVSLIIGVLYALTAYAFIVAGSYFAARR